MNGETAGKIMTLLLILLIIYQFVGWQAIYKLFVKNKDKRCKAKIHQWKKAESTKSGFSTVSHGAYECINCGRIEEVKQFASSESDPYIVTLQKGKFEN